MSEIQKEEMGRCARQRIDRLAPEVTVNRLVCFYRYVIEHTGKRV